MEGYIKLWRVLIEKPIWLGSTPEQKAVLITLMCMANHKENQWEWKGDKFKVEPGQFVTSLESIRKNTGLGISIQNVRSSIKRFEKLEFLTYKATKSGRVITICNWSGYQPEESVGQQRRQQRGNKGATPNKNDKNDKKYFSYKKDVPLPANIELLPFMKEYARSKGIGNGTIPDMFEEFCIWHTKKGTKYKDWYATWQTWVRKGITMKPSIATEDKPQTPLEDLMNDD